MKPIPTFIALSAMLVLSPAASPHRLKPLHPCGGFLAFPAISLGQDVDLAWV